MLDNAWRIAPLRPSPSLSTDAFSNINDFNPILALPAARQSPDGEDEGRLASFELAPKIFRQ